MATTSSFSFNLTDFNKKPWHVEEHDNWHIIDALMARFLAISNVKGVWKNALIVAVGERYIDDASDTIFEVLVAHTTSSSLTFVNDRLANTSFWQGVTVDLNNLGTWVTSTSYTPNDFVVDTNRYGVVTNTYTSDTSYNADVTAGNIITLIDLSTDLAAAAASATAAGVSEAAAAASAATIDLTAPGPIGGTTPGTGAFSTLSATGIADFATAGAYFGTAAAANLLDDYEEGTFTPVVADAASGGNAGTATVVGTYTKIGNRVALSIELVDIDTTGMTAGSDFFIRGLPFTSLTTGIDTGAIATTSVSFTGNISARISDNTSSVRIRESASGAGGDFVIVSEVTSPTADIYITITYPTTA